MQRCKAETTSTEFVKWQWFFRRELSEPKREELYLAQLAAEVRRTIVKTPGSVHPKQFILDFGVKQVRTPTDIKGRTAASKARWFGVTNLGKRKGKQ